MKLRLVVLLAGLAVLSGARLTAHHSHASTYFEGRTMEIQGEIAQVSIRNPHSWVHVSVTEANGEKAVWAVEWAAGAQLNRGGVTARTLRVGDKVKVIGQPPRNPDQKRMQMLVIVRDSDGWEWGRRPGEVTG